MKAREISILLIALGCVVGGSSTALSRDDPLELDRVRQDSSSSAANRPMVRRVIIRNQLVLKIPLQPRQSKISQYRLLDEPRCLSTRAITGARMSGQRSIDFLIMGDRHLRAHMSQDCKSLDFYGGFYLQPRDEKVCAGRDTIRTRMGGNCNIERFQLLQPINGSSLADE